MAKSKKEKFQQKNGNSQLYIIAGVLIAIILGTVFYLMSGDDSTNQSNVGAGDLSAGSASRIEEVTITPTITDDKVIIKKSEVEQNKIVKFDYEPVKVTLKSGAQVPFPLMAYISTSGKLNVAVRMCEPCNGLSFSTINGNILNCNVCGTQWDLETMKWNGVGAQSCGSYAPEIIPGVTINGDNVEIEINEFKDWIPRA